MRLFVAACSAIGLLLGVAPCARAQWSAQPNVNTPIATGEAQQAKPRLSATADGGAYISWWQSETAPVYWSLRMNRLTRDGVKAWPTDLVVSSVDQTGTFGATIVNGSYYDTNYDLITTASGDAVLVWTDFREQSSRNVYVQRINAGGIPLWSANGVALTSSATFKRDPRIVETIDGGIAAAWVETTTAQLRMASLRVDGAGLITSTTVVPLVTGTMTSRPPDRFELRPSPQGGVLLAYIREFSTSSSALRWIMAQHFALQGPPGNSAEIWTGTWNGGEPVVVSDNNISIQTQTTPFLSNHPRVAMLPTADGGAVLAFFDARTGTQNVYAQRLSSTGAPLWATGGVPVSTETARARIEPAIAHDDARDRTFVFSRESDAATSMRGLSVQVFNAAGARTLGDTAPLITMTSDYAYALRARISGDGAIVAWMNDAGTAPAAQTILAARVSAAGVPTWPAPITGLATNSSVKNFVQHPLDTTPAGAIARDGFTMIAAYPVGAVIAFQGTRIDTGDTFAQQVSTCGHLGAIGIADFDQSGVVTIDDIFIFLNAWFAADPHTDADGSGGITIDDIFVFLNRWFAGCSG